jgi:hypothetical protein
VVCGQINFMDVSERIRNTGTLQASVKLNINRDLINLNCNAGKVSAASMGDFHSYTQQIDTEHINKMVTFNYELHRTV